MTDDYWKEFKDLLDDDTSVNAQTIMAAIATLPDDAGELKLENADMVKAIRKAYSELTTEEKQQVEDEYLVKLIKAENAIAKLEAAQKKEEAGNTEE